MSRRPITVDDLWRLPRVGEPIPSPDGRWVVVPVTTYDTGEGLTRLWLLKGDADSPADADPRPLTAADISASQPSWSHDGGRLLFVRKPGGPAGDGKNGRPLHPDVPQLYLLDLTGGEAERLTDVPLGVASPRWFRDGTRVAFVTPVFREALSLAATADAVKAKKDEKVLAAVTEDRVYRYWDKWLTDGKVPHLFVMDLEGRQPFDLTPDSVRLMHMMEAGGFYRIRPDGGEILFEASRSEPPHDPYVNGVFVVDVPRTLGPKTKAPKAKLLSKWHKGGHASRPIYTPDGQHAVYGIQRALDFYADRVRLVVHNLKTDSHTVLTEGWDASAEGWRFDAGTGELFLGAEDRGCRAIYTLDLAKAMKDPDGHPPRQIFREGSVSAPHAAGGQLFAVRVGLRQPPEVVRLSADGKRLTALSDFTGPLLKDFVLSEVEEVYFTGAEGHKVQMFLLYPPGEGGGQAAAAVAENKKGKDKAKRSTKAKGKGHAPYPLVHMIHGGPHGAFGDEWHWRWNPHLFAAPGHLVALVNFHGSTGWGEAFTSSILGRWGDQPYHDVMAATDWLIAHGLADKDRMAATGGSYGGYLVSWIAGHTNRFKCLINHAGVCDFQAQMATDITQGRHRSFGGELWDRVEGFDQYNPLRYAKGFKSPMLVIHGEKDYRVPVVQGLEIYNVYKARNLPARLVYYPDENHWILKPHNSKHWYGEVMSWLARWLGKDGKG